jgi:glucose-6-phosphate 1-epimerase
MDTTSSHVHFNGTPCVRLQHASGASALIALHGAHLLSWISADGRERLFLSERARYGEGAAIRGGVPVIFPQFSGRGPLPRHGFARTLPWRLVDTETRATFELSDGPSTAIWPHAFCVRLHVALESAGLEVTLEVANIGTDPFAFTAALHTYLAIEDLDAVALHGLDDCRYEDSADGGAIRQQEHAQRFAGEVDRIYRAPSQPLTLQDGPHFTTIEQNGFTDTVVWNPGAALAAGIGDLAPDEYRRFVCVEAGQVLQPVRLSPGARWSGTQRLR